MKLLWSILALLHRVFDVVVHLLFRIANCGRKDELPPINNLLLLSSAASLAAKIRKKKLKSIDVVNAYICRVSEVNSLTNAAANYRFEQAMEEAKAVDELIESNQKTEEEMERETPFLGVPLSVKELIGIGGMPQSCGLVTRKNIRASSDAETVRLMRAAGAIPFVQTNISELGMWYESYNNVYGRTNNCYDTTRTSGGSSGGEGSLIGSAGSVIGIGSDIGGSIRIPAFFNGIFGHKPTSGVVSNFGSYPPSSEREFVPYLSTGPLCRYATDLIPMMQVLAGKNSSLLQSKLPVNFKELKVYYVEDVGNDLLYTKVEKDMIKAIHKVVGHFQNAYKVVPQKINLPALKHMYKIWSSALHSCKAPAFGSELGERKDGTINFKLELLQWLIGQSRFTLPAIILALSESNVMSESEHFIELGKQLKRDLLEYLGDNGILIFPSHPVVAPFNYEPCLKPFNFSYTGIFNITGFPVTQCPMGLGKESLPLGVQVISAPYNDYLTLGIAVELEKVFGGWICPCNIVE